MMGGYGGFGGFGGMGLLGMGLGSIFMVLFWVGVVILIVWGVKALTSSGHATGYVASPPANTPLELAKARYAKGEISRAEFDELKKDLT